MGKQRWLILVVLMCLSVTARAQLERHFPDTIAIPDYPFLKKELNRIQVPGGDSTHLDVFCRKLERFISDGEGRINIVHIGGSHVQADMFSNRMRQNLDALNGPYQTPRGFIFPFSVAKTNNPTNYKVSYSGEWNSARNVRRAREVPLGVGGIAVYTSDPEAKIHIRLNADQEQRRWEFEQLRLLGHTLDGSDKVRPVIAYNDTVLTGSHDAATSSYLFDMPETADSFTLSFVQEDTIAHPFVVNGFLPEREMPGIVYHAIGVNGASVPSYLSCERFEEELQLLSPDLVIFGIGINDATSREFSQEWFRYNYNQLLEMIERVAPDCAYVFITNNDSFKRVARNRYQVSSRGPIVKEVFFRLAEEHQGGVWDLFSMMGGLSSMRRWQNAGLARVDKIHFTREGYELLGDMLYNALIDYYGEYKRERMDRYRELINIDIVIPDRDNLLQMTFDE